MSVLFVLITISLVVSLGFLVTFIRAARAKQFEDDYTPSVKILFDDEPTQEETKK
jgi:cbb3-type cytochrome oxidase maturation protein